MQVLENIINWRGLFIAVPLVIFVLLLARVYSKRAKARRVKPGQYLEYIVPGHNCAQCRGILGKQRDEDIFEYELKNANSGGWYIHFTKHKLTGQQLDTEYLMQFIGDEPAAFSLNFISEAFGMREAVFGEELLDEFFEKKLGAKRDTIEE